MFLDENPKPKLSTYLNIKTRSTIFIFKNFKFALLKSMLNIYHRKKAGVQQVIISKQQSSLFHYYTAFKVEILHDYYYLEMVIL